VSGSRSFACPVANSCSKRAYRISGLCALAAALLALAIPGAASAGTLTDQAPSCETQILGQPFLPWADVASYTLNPGGSFDDGADGWSLTGASIAAGNEPYNVTAATDSASLSLPAGSSAVSAPICVGIEHPDIRFFANASNATARLSVEVLFESPSGDVASAPIGAVTGSSGWAPTAPFPIVANLLPLLPGYHTAVAFRFRASGGSFRVDDLYVDPYQRR
jgi:hypothetical protein